MAPPNKLIENAWKNYQRMALDPIKADPIQRRETKIAFYLGALALFEGIMSNLTPGDEPIEPDLNLMQSVTDELQEFTRNMKERGQP